MAVQFISKVTGEPVLSADENDTATPYQPATKGLTLSEQLLALGTDLGTAEVVEINTPEVPPKQEAMLGGFMASLMAEKSTLPGTVGGGVSPTSLGPYVAEAQVTITPQQAEGEVPASQETLQVVPFPSAKNTTPVEELAKVSINFGSTISTGEYQSVKVGVHISMPSKVEDVDATYNYIKDWAEGKMEKLVQEVVEAKAASSDS